MSSPLRAILLLSVSSPRRGIPIFYRYMERARRRLVLEIYCEESRDVALVVVHVLELFKFNICIV